MEQKVQSLEKNMSNEIVQTRVHTCNQCDKSFSHHGNLKLHQMTHDLRNQVEIPQTNAFQCHICQQSFSHHGNLKLHKMTHTLKKPVEIQKPRSVEIQKTRSNNEVKHLGNLKTYLNNKIEQCLQGKNSPKLNYDVKKYIHLDENISLKDESTTFSVETKETKLEHNIKENLISETSHKVDMKTNKDSITEPSGKTVFRCFLGCNKNFITSSTFWTHTSQMHKENSRICPLCCKALSGKKELARHVITHGENKSDYRRFLPYSMIGTLSKGKSFIFDGRKVRVDCICDQCGRISDKPNERNRHIKAVHSKAYKCSIPYCAKSFESEKLLKEHIKQNECDIDQKKFQCGQCDESFSIFQILKDHKRKHLNKPYMCRVCKNRFSSIDSLSIHGYTHTILKEMEIDINFEVNINSEEERATPAIKSADIVLEQSEDEESIDNPSEKVDFENHSDNITKPDNEINFKCSLGCRMGFQTPYDFWSHTSQMHRANSRICPLCCKTLSGRKELARHVIVHGETKFNYRRFLPNQMIATLGEESDFEFDGRKVRADCVCDQCGKIFDKERDKFRHIRIVHTKAFKCSIPYCAKSYERESTLKEHLKQNVCDIDDKKFQCDKCDESFSKLEVLKDHGRQHIDKPHKCETCENRFSSIDSLSVHSYVHTILSGIPCDLCDERFDKEYLLGNHKKKIHSLGIQTNQFTCRDCGKICLSNSILKNHILKHTKVKNFICNLCGKALKREKNLDLHMRRHSGKKQYQCDQCQASFFTSSAFNYHKRVKHRKGPEESFLCTYCGVSKNTKAKLKHHITLHTGEKRYKCAHCEKRFRNYGVRENHEKSHTGVKNFKCQYCSKAFSSKINWERHTAIHTGERRHVCPVCRKTFIEPRGVRKHMKIHHKDSQYIRIIKPKSSENKMFVS